MNLLDLDCEVPCVDTETSTSDSALAHKVISARDKRGPDLLDHENPTVERL